MLSGYKILDLTDERGSLCGKILADLGADVVKVERPGGDPARRIGPFYHDANDPETSLHWLALNSGKRGITLNLENREGQEIFERLSDRVDIIVESYPPGYMDGLGLGYGALSSRSPRLIMTSITPFGQTGPYRDRRASDIVLLAMSGLMSITGDPDRPPLRMCLDQSYRLAGGHAAVGTLLALRHRRITGEGQRVDVSTYECAVRANYWEPARWEFQKAIIKRMGNRFVRTRAAGKQLWRCKDGYVTWLLTGGDASAKMTRALIRWMDETGRAGSLKEIEWETIHLSEVNPEELTSWEEVIESFLLTHTKDEIEAEAFKRNIPMCRVNEIDDVAKDRQLASRGYWTEIQVPKSHEEIKQPGFLFLSSGASSKTTKGAPLIGEHNGEVYRKELGFSEETISSLKERGVI